MPSEEQHDQPSNEVAGDRSIRLPEESLVAVSSDPGHAPVTVDASAASSGAPEAPVTQAPDTRNAEADAEIAKKVLLGRISKRRGEVTSLKTKESKLVEKLQSVEALYTRSEEDLKSLQSVGQVVGEVVGPIDDDHLIVKAANGPRYVVGCKVSLRGNRKLKPGTRITLDMTTLTLMRLLPRQVDPIFHNMIVEENLKVKFDDVGGLEEQVRKMRETIELPLTNPEIFQKVGVKTPKGVLLFGPPGTGKCVTGDTILATNAGLIYMKDVPKYFHVNADFSVDNMIVYSAAMSDAPEGTPMNSYMSLSCVQASVSHWHKLTHTSTTLVETALGHVLEGTPEHPIVVFDKSGRVSFKHLGNLALGDVVVLRMNVPLHGVESIYLSVQAIEAAAVQASQAFSEADGGEILLQLLLRIARSKQWIVEAFVRKFLSLSHSFKHVGVSAIDNLLLLQCLLLHAGVVSSVIRGKNGGVLFRVEDFGRFYSSSFAVEQLDCENPQWAVDIVQQARRQRFHCCNDLLLVPVERIDKGNNFVYDLTVKDTKNYVANGFINHNTLLAKALASNVKCKFMKVVASAIVDKYIGESARVIREMFAYAKENAPAIIFIDEIDAIGGRRFQQGTSADREIQRTLMELLAQMDGFNDLTNVKIIMATNRPDILDPALLRPGRLDRRIEIPLPNDGARMDILKIHMKNMALKGEVDLDVIVKLTENFNGADLRNLCTESGMNAIREDRDYCVETDFLKAARKLGDNKKLETKLEYTEV